ncbi:hypothetical protein GCM10023339_77250 [Alloalcanivorax gelatiniphagus]
MTGDLSARLQQPRFGVVLISAVLSLLVSLHWAPMAVPSLVVLVLCLVRPAIAVRPLTWWLLAAAWAVALVVAAEHMEDHVPLFTVWLVALAVSLRRPEDEFLPAAALQARLLIGVTFAAAVCWKLWFGTYLSGVTLWTYMVADDRFGPLATVVGLSQDEMAADRTALSGVLDGTTTEVTLQAAALTETAIVVVAVLTLLLEAVIALSHLAPDSSRLALLRLPSVVLFAVATYGTVPVVPFAVLLALLTMTIGRWRPRVMWVLPAFMVVVATRVALMAI